MMLTAASANVCEVRVAVCLLFVAGVMRTQSDFFPSVPSESCFDYEHRLLLGGRAVMGTCDEFILLLE